MTGTLLLCVCILIMSMLTEPQNKQTFQNLKGDNVDLGNVTPEMINKLLSSKNLKNQHGKSFDLSSLKVGNGLNGQNFDLSSLKGANGLNGKSFDFSSLKGGNGRYKQIIATKFHPINQTLDSKAKLNGSLFSYKNWYKNVMNGKNGSIDIRNLIKGNIVESKHSKVVPFILDEEGFREFKKKNPNHKYIYAQTMKIMNDQEMQHLQRIKSKLKNLLEFSINGIFLRLVD